MGFEGRTALITAGAAGVGRAMAEAFAAEGAAIHVVDTDAAALAALPRDWGRSCFDVRDEAAVAALFADLPAVDILCANAGIAGPTALVEDVALADWRDCVAVNLDAAFLFAKYAAPGMKARGAGSMLFTSSTAGLHGYPRRSPYAAAKWALIGLAKTLAMELGPFGVRANALCPGSVAGARMDGVIAREAAATGRPPEEIRAGYASGVAMGRFVEAKDCAAAAVFLASEAGRFISGQAIPVDGFTVSPDP